MKKLAKGFLLLMVALVASAWVTSWAIEPEAFGEARAPDPLQHDDAIIQVYGGDVWGFRGNFAIHTWIATKARGASRYQVYEVVSWNLRRANSVVRITNRDPDRPWARSPAILLHEIRGAEADALIDRETLDAKEVVEIFDDVPKWEHAADGSMRIQAPNGQIHDESIAAVMPAKTEDGKAS